MSAEAKTYLAVALGVTATAVLVSAEVLGWPLGPVAAGMLGAIGGFVPGYLAPSPAVKAEQ